MNFSVVAQVREQPGWHIGRKKKKQHPKHGHAPPHHQHAEHASEEIEEAEFDPAVFASKMETSVSIYREKLSLLRSGPITPDLFESVSVTTHGKRKPFKSVAKASVKDSKTILITLLDQTAAPDVLRAIKTIPLELDPKHQGASISVPIPKVTKESKLSLAKVASGYQNEAKHAIRKIRGKGLAALKDFIGPKDAIRALEGKVTEAADKHTKRIDELYKAKEKELKS